MKTHTLVPGRDASRLGRRTLLIAAVFAGTLSGCLGSTPPATFYTLTALPPPAVERSELAVLVGPITLPRYLDRPQIVTREEASRMHVAELHRWAGTLAGDVLRVLALDLAHHIGTNRVAVYPEGDAFPLDYLVAIDVFRLDGRLDTEVVLDARFTVRPGSGGDPLRVARVRFVDRVQPQTYPGLVASHERVLTLFGAEIADVLRELGHPDPTP